MEHLLDPLPEAMAEDTLEGLLVLEASLVDHLLAHLPELIPCQSQMTVDSDSSLDAYILQALAMVLLC